MAELDLTDRRLLNALQGSFQLVERPFAAVAEDLGIDEDEVLSRTQALRDAGVLRHLSPIFDVFRLGYKSALVAVAVDPARLEEAAAVISAHPGVSHNYAREHRFNIWFVMAIPREQDFEATVASLAGRAGAERHIVRETDVDPYFDTLVWNPKATLAAWLADSTLTAVDPRANFGGAVELVAFRILTPVVKPGETASTITFWRILDPAALGPRDPINYAPEAQLFVHVLDRQGNYVIGSDRLHAPAWNWHAGDTFAQIHRMTLPADLPPGQYSLRAGIYTLPDRVRLTGADFDSYGIGAIAVVAP